jgi:hypothetical protein
MFSSFSIDIGMLGAGHFTLILPHSNSTEMSDQKRPQTAQ